MAGINLCKVGEVGPNSVGAEQLKDNAVDLDSSKVTGQLPSTKLADGAVIESKLDNLAVSTAKLKDNAVTLAKADDDSKLSHYVTDETPVNVEGITEEEVKLFPFVKVAGVYASKKIRVLGSLKTNNALYQATMNLYFDDEVTPFATFDSTEDATFELVSGEYDISSLSAGRHTCKIKLVSADASGIAYNDFIDIKWIKG